MSVLLPRSRAEILHQITQEAGIDDTDYSRASAAYSRRKQNKRTNVKPPVWKGGEFDSFKEFKRQTFTSLLEAFEYAARGAWTWQDIQQNVIPKLRSVPGFETASIPADAYLDRLMQRDIPVPLLYNDDVHPPQDEYAHWFSARLRAAIAFLG